MRNRRLIFATSRGATILARIATAFVRARHPIPGTRQTLLPSGLQRTGVQSIALLPGQSFQALSVARRAPANAVFAAPAHLTHAEPDRAIFPGVCLFAALSGNGQSPPGFAA